jgi:WD40 repeat protein
MWIWKIDETTARLLRRIELKEGFGFHPDLDPTGHWFAYSGPLPANRLWSLSAPVGAEPLELRRGPVSGEPQLRFSPDGRWLAAPDSGSGLVMWALGRPYPATIQLVDCSRVWGVEFGPEGRFLIASANEKVQLWPLEGAVPAAGRTVFEWSRPGPSPTDVTVSPSGEWFAVSSHSGGVWIGRDDGAEPRQIPGTKPVAAVDFTFSLDGRLLAWLGDVYDIKNAVFAVWDVESFDEVAVLRLDDAEFRYGSSFTSDGRLLTGTTKGVVAWDVATGNHEILVEAPVLRFAASEDGRRLLLTEEGEGGLQKDPRGPPIFVDLDTGETIALASHGLHVRAIALDRDGQVAVTCDANGVIRVGPVTGEDPHLLLGHDGDAVLAIDPLGRWIASGGQDKTVRLWPMPDLSKPPLHTLPREELIAKLKTLTNLRVVRDEDSPTGWKLTHDPFPGWETVPTW